MRELIVGLGCGVSRSWWLGRGSGRLVRANVEGPCHGRACHCCRQHHVYFTAAATMKERGSREGGGGRSRTVSGGDLPSCGFCALHPLSTSEAATSLDSCQLCKF